MLRLPQGSIPCCLIFITLKSHDAIVVWLFIMEVNINMAGVKMHHCYHVGCHELLPFEVKYCRKHTINKIRTPEDSKRDKFYNQYKRDKEANSFYHSKRWTDTRNYIVARDMYVSGVSAGILNDKDIIVDHIIPLRLLNGDDRYEMSNLWLLSRKEHNIKTKLEQSMKPNQLRHVSKDWWIKVIKEKL